MSQQAEGVPSCFGKLYDHKAPECIGGYDPAYYQDGTHVRPACDHVRACAPRMQAAKNQQIVPISNLTRPTTTTTTTFHVPPTAPQYRPPAPQTYAPQTYAPPSQHQVNMQQLVAVNYAIPQYLTVREPHDGRSMGKRLFVEAFRSIGKSLGHTLAHFFDAETFGGGK